MHTGGRGAPHVPLIKIFEKLPHKNAIKHDPPDFLITPSTPLKRICQKTPRNPPSPLNFQLLCIYEFERRDFETMFFLSNIFFSSWDFLYIKAKKQK
jgi:hypothetical protein